MQHPLAITQPALRRASRDLGFALTDVHRGPASANLRRPALVAHHVVSPALAATDQVLALGNQALVQLASEHGDALSACVVAKLWQVMHTLRLRLERSTPSSR